MKYSLIRIFTRKNTHHNLGHVEVPKYAMLKYAVVLVILTRQAFKPARTQLPQAVLGKYFFKIFFSSVLHICSRLPHDNELSILKGLIHKTSYIQHFYLQ